MFTFGRDHEIKHVITRFGSEEKAALVVNVVNAVHDVLEGKAPPDHVEEPIKRAFIEGAAGTWESAGSWLLNLQGDFPFLEHIWFDLVKHPSASVRFRVAGHIIDLPAGLRQKIYDLLKNDSSKKVRELAEGKWDYCQHPEKYA